MVTVGLILIVLGARELSMMGGRVSNGPMQQDQHELVISGVYNFTRNPMYVGEMCAVLGLAITANTLCALLAAPNPHVILPITLGCVCAQIRHGLR
jgi:protein-S-isoprenylcysteine O-methyltransferase Ste14